MAQHVNTTYPEQFIMNALFRMSCTSLVTLGLMVPFSAMAAGADAAQDKALETCSPARMAHAGLETLSSDEGTGLCMQMRDKLRFVFDDGDMSILASTAVATRVVMAKRGEDASVSDTVARVLEIVELRGLLDSKDGFDRTVAVVGGSMLYTGGAASPDALATKMREHPEISAKMTDSNIITFSAILSGDDATELSSDSMDAPDGFHEKVMEWNIDGIIIHGGSAMACRMEHATSDASKTFSYIMAVAGDSSGVTMSGLFAVQTKFADSGSAKMILTFDNARPYVLGATSSGGTMQAKLPILAGRPGEIVNMLRKSHHLTLKAVSGKSVETETVDMSAADMAMDRSTACLKDTMDKAISIIEQGRH